MGGVVGTEGDPLHGNERLPRLDTRATLIRVMISGDT